jgi:hypothetical protein
MTLFRIGFLATLLAVASAGVGQTSPGDVVVDVPFAFSVAGTNLPAGHYIVAQQIDMIKIFNHHKQSVFVPTHSTLRTKPDGSKLVFHHYGDTYFLSEVWVTGNKTGKQLFPSRAEREFKARQAEMELAVVRPAQ